MENLAGPVVYFNTGSFLAISFDPKEVLFMSIPRPCSFYRDTETLNMGRGIGYCDLDCDRTTCDGDIKFCEKPDILRKYLLEQKKREEGLGWEKKKNAHFSGNQRV
jgi:hypothetical protein